MQGRGPACSRAVRPHAGLSTPVRLRRWPNAVHHPSLHHAQVMAFCVWPPFKLVGFFDLCATLALVAGAVFWCVRGRGTAQRLLGSHGARLALAPVAPVRCCCIGAPIRA